MYFLVLLIVILSLKYMHIIKNLFSILFVCLFKKGGTNVQFDLQGATVDIHREQKYKEQKADQKPLVLK